MFLKAEPGDLVFIIQPILNEEADPTRYQPLADYLGKITASALSSARCRILSPTGR